MMQKQGKHKRETWSHPQTTKRSAGYDRRGEGIQNKGIWKRQHVTHGNTQAHRTPT